VCDLILQLVPFSYLTTWRTQNFIPVIQGRSAALGSTQLQTANNLRQSNIKKKREQSKVVRVSY
jgi:hypothetical protein